MIAVPCSPMLPDSRIRSPGRSAAGDSRARGSRRPIPVVHTYMPSAWPRSTTFVSPATISTPAVRAACAIASTSALSCSRFETLLEDQREAERERPRAGHGQVVDRPVDRELADRAAREAQRLDHVGVGRERELHVRRRVTVAASASSSSAAEANAGASRPSIRLWVALPPAPWAMLIRSSRNLARLPRAVSMIPRILRSRSETTAGSAVTRPPARGRTGRSCSRPRRRPPRRPCRCRSAARACRRCRTPCTPTA